MAFRDNQSASPPPFLIWFGGISVTVLICLSPFGPVPTHLPAQVLVLSTPAPVSLTRGLGSPVCHAYYELSPQTRLCLLGQSLLFTLMDCIMEKG